LPGGGISHQGEWQRIRQGENQKQFLTKKNESCLKGKLFEENRIGEKEKRNSLQWWEVGKGGSPRITIQIEKEKRNWGISLKKSKIQRGKGAENRVYASVCRDCRVPDAKAEVGDFHLPGEKGSGLNRKGEEKSLPFFYRAAGKTGKKANSLPSRGGVAAKKKNVRRKGSLVSCHSPGQEGAFLASSSG